MCGSGVPARREMRRDLARCVSRKVRCRPPSLAKGCSALTTPAPCVQREPAPAASVTTATSPLRSAASPRAFERRVCRRGQVGDVLRAHVLDDRVGGQTILREADAALAQMRADLLVLLRVEAVRLEQRGQRLVAGRRPCRAGTSRRRASAPCRAAPASCGRRRRIYRAPRGAAARACADPGGATRAR